MKIKWSTLSAAEKNSLMATKVMGWAQSGHARPTDAWWHNGAIASRKWSPINNVLHAHRIIEVMRTKGFVVNLGNNLYGDWEVTFQQSGPPNLKHLKPVVYFACADSFTDAICQAALLAHGCQLE